MKTKLFFAIVVVALCLSACEKSVEQPRAVNALHGKWTWRSQMVGCAPEYISIETPETTGEKRELLFDEMQWHYFVNDSLVKENTYSCSLGEQPDTLWWNYGSKQQEIIVKWFALDSISLDLEDGGGCQGPSVWKKLND